MCNAVNRGLTANQDIEVPEQIPEAKTLCIMKENFTEPGIIANCAAPTVILFF